MKATKRGRPKTTKGQRIERTTITFHPDELETIKAAAKKAKTKPVTFIRDAALTKALG